MAKTIEEIANSLFDDGETMDKDTFIKKVNGSGLKIADLSDGDFVTKQKYEDHVAKMKKIQADYDALKANPSDSEQYKALEKERDEWKAKFEDSNNKVLKSEHRNILKTNKVKDEFSDFVDSEIAKNVSETVDYETAAKKYIADHQQYIVKDEPQSSGLKLNNGQSGNDDIFADIEKMIRE